MAQIVDAREMRQTLVGTANARQDDAHRRARLLSVHLHFATQLANSGNRVLVARLVVLGLGNARPEDERDRQQHGPPHRFAPFQAY